MTYEYEARHKPLRGHTNCSLALIPPLQWHRAMVEDSEWIVWEHYTETETTDSVYAAWAHANAMLKTPQVRVDPRTGRETTGADVSRWTLVWHARTWYEVAASLEARAHELDVQHHNALTLWLWRKSCRHLRWAINLASRAGDRARELSRHGV